MLPLLQKRHKMAPRLLISPQNCQKLMPYNHGNMRVQKLFTIPAITILVGRDMTFLQNNTFIISRKKIHY